MSLGVGGKATSQVLIGCLDRDERVRGTKALLQIRKRLSLSRQVCLRSRRFQHYARLIPRLHGSQGIDGHRKVK